MLLRPHMEILSIAVLLLGWNTAASGLDPSQCIAPLGMESGSIRDEDIRASSSFDHSNVGPQHGRMRMELNGGAWCPQTAATSEPNEWLEIDLRSVHMVTAVEVQGRFGNGQGAEWAEAYKLEYWRPRLAKWMRYQQRHDGDDVLRGNVNTYLEAKSVLDPPMVASRVRFLPFSQHKRTVCMRVELYGCRWTDGVVSYSMPQGDKRGAAWEFYDTAYDGHWDGERLRDGLGHLTDGRIAPDDFKLPFYDHSLQGWIGWRNDTRDHHHPIEITFEFDRVRIFSAVHIYANNQFAKDVQVFGAAALHFSIAGRTFKGEPITFDYVEDCIFETARNVTIRLHHRVGRFVKLQLHFAARWMLISEITFDSAHVTGNFTEEETEDHDTNGDEEGSTTTTLTNDELQKQQIATASGGRVSGQYLGIVVGFLAVIVVLLLAGSAYVCIQHRRYKSSPRQSNVAGTYDKAALYHEHPDPEYAVPLQATASPPPQLRDLFPKPPPPPLAERYYAATEICSAGFTPPPPPPPLTTPPPVRLSRQPRYVSNCRAFVGP